jgi:hypothetical protein
MAAFAGLIRPIADIEDEDIFRAVQAALEVRGGEAMFCAPPPLHQAQHEQRNRHEANRDQAALGNGLIRLNRTPHLHRLYI